MKSRQLTALLAVVLALALWPSDARAQVSSITGVVRDSSGAVLPGVTVEAASPALIEKVRIAVTDDAGLYRLVDLRPGDYTVVFTLPGFSTLRRDALALPANFTATVNVEMTVGAIDETITVTGEAPMVDIQSTRQQTQFQRETLEAIPTTGRLTGLSQVIPGTTLQSPAQHSVGGVNDSAQYTFTLHGAPMAEPVVDGMSQVIGITNGVFIFNQATFAEVVVETSGVGADRDTGGMQLNIIQRDGGNQFSGGLGFSYSGPAFESDNITDELVTRNLSRSNVGGLKKYRDVTPSFGGPIMRDRLWFFAAGRDGVNQQLQQGNYYNKLQATTPLFYEPDLSRPAATNQYSKDVTGRVTWQAAQKHKVIVAATSQPNCNCLFSLLTLVPPSAPEATGEHHYNKQFHANTSWKYTASDRVLIEATMQVLSHYQQTTRVPGTGNAIQVTDTGTNYRYGSRGLNLGTSSYLNIPRGVYEPGVNLTYLAGAHNVKAGFLLRRFSTGDVSKNTDGSYQINQGMTYTFRNRVPTNVTIWAVPFVWEEQGQDISAFVQDQWTLGRATLNLGIRYNEVNNSTGGYTLAAGPFVPERHIAEVKNTPHWRNLNPRVGVAYDMFGTGRTALKASLGRYTSQVRSTNMAAPAVSVSPSANRSWNDTLFGAGDPRSGNYVPDCDLRSPVTNGECGPWNNLAFGTNLVPTKNAEDAISGFNGQDYNWQGSASVQHELRPGVALNVGYFRTWYGNFLATRNQAVNPATDYDEYCFMVPTDARLVNSGERLCGLYDIRPAVFGRVDNLVTQASHFGERTQVYNGVDVTMAARFGSGGQFSGGVSMGRTVTDNCAVVNSPQDARPGFCKIVPPWSSGTQLKFMAIYPLPLSMQASVIYQNFGGIENNPTVTLTNAQIAPSLGRNLAACGAAAVCNQTVTVDMAPAGSMYEPRIQQVDVRLSGLLRLGGSYRIRGNFDVANLLNVGNVLSLQRQYGPTYLNAVQIMGGRLMKVGFQFDF
jgi:hypothetical protein